MVVSLLGLCLVGGFVLCVCLCLGWQIACLFVGFGIVCLDNSVAYFLLLLDMICLIVMIG